MISQPESCKLMNPSLKCLPWKSLCFLYSTVIRSALLRSKREANPVMSQTGAEPPFIQRVMPKVTPVPPIILQTQEKTST
jgi:hypothetical protein